MIRSCLAILTFSLSVVNLWAQQTAFKFDFGMGKTANGYIPVTPDTRFNYQQGYGFNHDADIKAIDRNNTPVKGDFITSDKPFYFSVKLPDGNYDVKLMLGDANGSSATTVRVENRRLMLHNIRTGKSEITEQRFTVHVKDSLIRRNGSEEKIALKPRESSYLHWDNLLTIEFNDSLPKVCALEITPNIKATTIFLAGNSTVVDQDREPWAAWGQIFPVFLKPGIVAVANYAESGETLKAFEREGRLAKILSLVKPGDYLFIEFAHNDQKPGINHLDAFTTYKQKLKEWIDSARQHHVTPVLVTSMHRRNFDSTGHIINTLESYPDAMREISKEENVSLIDLNGISRTLYETWGEQNSIKAFVHYPANTFPNQAQALQDNTHFSPYGAYALANCIVYSILEQHLPLSKYIRGDIQTFDPAHPILFDKFYWPLSSMTDPVKPDGN